MPACHLTQPNTCLASPMATLDKSSGTDSMHNEGNINIQGSLQAPHLENG